MTDYEVMPVANSSGAGTPKVLIAEDDLLLRDLVSSQLQASGYAVVEASSGDQALSLMIDGERADILVTDISMPGSLDGWALAIRSRQIDPRIAVIYTTSKPQNAGKQVTRSIYVSKPFHPDLIISAVRQLTGYYA